MHDFLETKSRSLLCSIVVYMKQFYRNFESNRIIVFLFFTAKKKAFVNRIALIKLKAFERNLNDYWKTKIIIEKNKIIYERKK